jgi:hypothetical protein
MDCFNHIYRRKAFSSALSSASASASTAIYGDSKHQATKSASSLSSQASASVSSFATRATDATYEGFDETKDYVYSTWNDNQLRSWLEHHGYIKTKQQATRDEMLAKMKEAYASATDPIYHAWSDSYMRKWLIEHNVMSEPPTQREKLMNAMNEYYYGSKVLPSFLAIVQNLIRF